MSSTNRNGLKHWAVIAEPIPAMMTQMSLVTRTLLIAATLVSGWLAGGNIDRALVAMPAWQDLGVVAWAEFSRHADLGNGLFLYPLEAFGGALLTLAAAIGIRVERNARRAVALAVYAAVLFAAAGLAFTIKAAPIMLSIRGVTDAATLQRAFEGFWYWGNIRGACQVLAFAAQLLALAFLLPTSRRPS